jgi:ABC-type Mn2+/Zn2+ transport system permease subunit
MILLRRYAEAGDGGAHCFVLGVWSLESVAQGNKPQSSQWVENLYWLSSLVILLVSSIVMMLHKKQEVKKKGPVDKTSSSL